MTESLRLSKRGVEMAQMIDPSVSNSKEAAGVLKKSLEDEILNRQENITHEVWVMSRGGTPEGRDYYEDVGTINNEMVMDMVIPSICEWFRIKYQGNKDAYLDVQRIGKVPFHMMMSSDMEDKVFGSVYQEGIDDE